jgi:hypothetical protein
MALCSVAAAWLVSNPDLELDDSGIELAGLSYTEPAEVRALIGLPAGARQNVFLLRTADMERALASLPAVAAADVAALLPDRLVVDIKERTPLFVVRNDAGDHLVDVEGVVLDLIPERGGDALALPVLADSRDDTAPVLEVGGRLQEPDLSAVRQLLALSQADLGSAAQSLVLTADDEEGFVLAAQPDGWRAVFGHYTPTLRPVEMIARQAQCLRTLLAEGEGEAEIATIFLAPLDDRCGTYLPRTTPTPAASPTPAG